MVVQGLTIHQYRRLAQRLRFVWQPCSQMSRFQYGDLLTAVTHQRVCDAVGMFVENSVYLALALRRTNLPVGHRSGNDSVLPIHPPNSDARPSPCQTAVSSCVTRFLVACEAPRY
jgi:hypothetical protein